MCPVPQDADSEAGSTETDVSKVRRRRIPPQQQLPRVSLVLMKFYSFAVSRAEVTREQTSLKATPLLEV